MKNFHVPTTSNKQLLKSLVSLKMFVANFQRSSKFWANGDIEFLEGVFSLKYLMYISQFSVFILMLIPAIILPSISSFSDPDSYLSN